MQKLLTIVVPVYKVEPYIKKCLDSCLIYKTDEQGNRVLDAERMNQLEVIIVNDGTPDRSAEMSREYVKRYPQTFRQIDKENGGHGSAWNVGLKQTTGKYLRFLDSDDWLTNLDKLMEKLSETDADLVFTQLYKYMVADDEFVLFPVNGMLNQAFAVADFPYQANNDITVADFQYCTYKTALLKAYHPLFDEHIFYDDMILFIAPQLMAKTCYICDFVLYNYFIGRAGQTMDAKVQERNRHFMIQEYEKMLSFYQQHGVGKEGAPWAQHAIVSYAAQHFMPKLICLPYPQSRIEGEKLKHDLSPMTELRPRKQLKRLLKWPYWAYYLVEKIRYFKNKK